MQHFKCGVSWGRNARNGTVGFPGARHCLGSSPLPLLLGLLSTTWGTRGERFPSQITPGLMLAAIPPRNRLGNAQEHTHVCCGAALPSVKTHTHHSHHSHGDFFSMFLNTFFLTKKKKKRHYSLAARPVSVPCATPSEQPGAVALAPALLSAMGRAAAAAGAGQEQPPRLWGCSCASSHQAGAGFKLGSPPAGFGLLMSGGKTEWGHKAGECWPGAWCCW